MLLPSSGIIRYPEGSFNFMITNEFSDSITILEGAEITCRIGTSPH
jgi:hypothetical protein